LTTCLSKHLEGSVHAPNATGNLHQGGDDGRAAEEPGEGGATAASEPEATGEFRPAGLGEEIRGGMVDRGVWGLHIGAAAGGAIDREAHREDRHQADGGQQTGGVGVFREPQGAGEGEGPKEEEAMGHPHLQTPPIGREGRAVGRQGVEESLREIAAVDGSRQVADTGVGHRGDGHGGGGKGCLWWFGNGDGSVAGFNHVEQQGHGHGRPKDSH